MISAHGDPNSSQATAGTPLSETACVDWRKTSVLGAKELRYWSSRAREDSRQDELTNNDIQELVQYFIEDAGSLDPRPPSLSLLESTIASPSRCHVAE